MRMCVAFLFVTAAYHVSLAASPCMQLEEAVQKRLLLVAAKPEYPYEAKAREAKARDKATTGLFELRFDYESGHLREVHVVKSTGDRYLDGHAIGALKVWQAKPRSIHNLCVPITFTLSWRH